jgi:hypothetical protein
MVEKALGKDDGEGLKKLRALLCAKVGTHDADQAAAVPDHPALAPAPSAPAVSSAPPILRPSHPTNTRNSGTHKCPRPEAPGEPDAFLERLRLFAFEYGNTEHGSLNTVHNDTVYKAFQALPDFASEELDGALNGAPRENITPLL